MKLLELDSPYIDEDGLFPYVLVDETGEYWSMKFSRSPSFTDKELNDDGN